MAGRSPSFADLRVVEGKLYNVATNILWEDVKGQCVIVLTNGVVLREVLKSGTNTVLGNELFFVRNLRPELSLTRSNITCRALPTGTTDYQGAKIKAYDFGEAPSRPRPPGGLRLVR